VFFLYSFPLKEKLLIIKYRGGYLNMNKKKIIAIAVIILLVIITGLVIKKMVTTEKVKEEGFVFDKSSSIKLKDIETYYKVIDFKKENAKDYFKDKVVIPTL
jgi:hypothetical protein